ncbi:SulP family inorganic anion transporter [Lysobacter sp. TY2-98]|uniref:SulP family inorganic anion transporter n=1 Tax=Lysobacter sp. TY2-98 TaxID=2290922 RepID=UPI000E20B00E|nr:SulP family inorganic anion transporter [Lysobacter sp. TY2-98]AXK71786.1 SulP family inorganic anion transporter [Lysobacter sp. TY2-98]
MTARALLPYGWRDYRWRWLPRDAMAGITTAAVVLPQTLAYAALAGVPAYVGLYTACVPALVYAFVGTSRALSVSSTATVAMLTGAALTGVAPFANADELVRASATLSLLTGLMLVIAAVLRFGFLANFISAPVLTGFRAGVAIVVLIEQLPRLFGLHIRSGRRLQEVADMAMSLPDTSWATLALGATSVFGILAMQRRWPRLPSTLIAVMFGTTLSFAFDLGAHGVEVVGRVPVGLPSLVRPNTALIGELWPAAMGIALMSFIQSLAAAQSVVRAGEPYPNADVELRALGMAGVGGSLFGCLPASGATMPSTVNDGAGARSQLSGLFVALLALVAMEWLAPLLERIPNATLAAIAIVFTAHLISPREFAAIRAVRRTEFTWALVAMLGVVAFGALRGIVVAIVVSLMSLAYQTLRPRLHVLRRKPGTRRFRPQTPRTSDDEDVPGLLVLRPEGRLFFGNAAYFGERIQPLIAESKPRVILLDLRAVFDIEYTALMALTDAEAKQRAAGTDLWLAGMTPDVLETLRRAPLYATLGEGRIFASVADAIAAWDALPHDREAEVVLEDD